MELTDAMRTTFTCRRFAPEPVPDAVFYRAIEAARFGPQGGNRQPVRFVIVRDVGLREKLGELYQEVWEPYRDALLKAAGPSSEPPPPLLAADEFASDFGVHPTLAVVCADLALIHSTDTELGRLSVVGGASIYPLVQNFCLALRDQGVGTAITTLLVAREPDVKKLLGIPPEWSTACHLAVGYPTEGFPQRLKRLPVGEIAFVDQFGTSLPAS